VIVYNASNLVIHKNLKIEAVAICEGSSDLQVSLNKQISKYQIWNSLSSIKIPMKLYPGENIINFNCNARKRNELEDTRNLSFAIYKMEIAEDE